MSLAAFGLFAVPCVLPGAMAFQAAAQAEAAAAGAPAGETDQPAPERPEIARLREAAGAGGENGLGLSVSVRSFKAEDGSTYAVFVAGIPKDRLVPGADGEYATVIYARIEARDGGEAKPIEVADQGLYRVEESGGWRLYGFAISLPAGQYQLVIAACDGPVAPVAVVAEPVELADYASGGLALSSVTLAAATEAAANGDEKVDPYRFGRIRLFPRMSRRIGPGEELAFYYQVYGAAPGEEDGQPSLDVSYDFRRQDGGEWRKALREPVRFDDQKQRVLGWALPPEALAKWPAGEWKVLIRVEDTIAGTTAAAEVPFSLMK